MESTPVNWEALDALIVDFVKSENLVEDSSPSPSPLSSPLSSPRLPLSSSSYHSRVIIRQIRRSIEAGDIDSAISLRQSHASFVLDDHRLLFRLQKQKFVELLRKGTAEDRDAAIDCLRTSLAPCALDAYPEAYEEFKHVLLAFIYDKDDHTSPVANEWAERRRFEIAGLMSSVLRAFLHAYDPVFSMTIRYLISIHKGFCFRQGIPSPISDLTERLLLEERDAPATPQEGLYEAPPFDEVDIQALAHAVELTRQGAVDSLKFAKGDLFQAFQNELCRMRVDVSMLDELVREYCIYRGIIESEISALHGQLKRTQSDSAHCSSRNCCLEMDSSSSKHSDEETSTKTFMLDGSPSNSTDITSRQTIAFESRYASEPTSNNEDCSTSWSLQNEHARVLLRNKNHVIGERTRRKRWRGRCDEVAHVSDVSFGGDTKEEICFMKPDSSSITSKEQQPMVKHSASSIGRSEDKYEIILGMKELASRGMASEAVDEISTMDPDFFTQNPVLLFQLKQVEFLKLVSSGDHRSALKVACSHLGPLAANDPSLLRPLKETLLALLNPSVDGLEKVLPLNALAASLQVAIGRRLGIEEPQLMKLMRATLHSHTEWFKLNMCKDRFEGLLKIDSLKDVNPNMFGCAATSNTDSCTHGSSQVTTCSSAMTPEDGSSSTQASSRDVIWDENAILKVMEFLALPRADAIQLLSQYNGSAETVIQQLFA